MEKEKRPMYGNELLEKELKASFNFFYEERNKDKESNGYGLIKDQYANKDDYCSVASCGFGLVAYIIGVEHGFISKEEGKELVLGMLNTLMNNTDHINGFLYHFLDMETAKKKPDSEVSIIDTALLLAGAIVAADYYREEIFDIVEEFYKRIDWRWFLNEETNQFFMGYSDEKGHDGKWDMYGEQLICYILAVASPTFAVDKDVYYGWEKEKQSYKEHKDIVTSYLGSIFVYQYSHAFIDFKGKKDKDGIDWFENSRKAILANRQYCIDHQDKFKTYSENSWGLTACMIRGGYIGDLGAKPNKEKNSKDHEDGTVAISAATGSIVFTPEESIRAIEYYYNEFDKLWDKYGFVNSYNLDIEWFCDDNTGIDKGISMIMIENYLNHTIWDLFMKNRYVKKGMELLEIK